MAQPVIPGVVFQPHTHEGLRRGINQLAAIIRPTLGPQPRHVVVEQTFRDKTPELLDNAALIARRIVQLSDRDADPGAMLLRHALWRIHDDVGDGTATAAVLFHRVYNQALRYLAAGGNAMHLRRALHAVQDDALAELDRQTRAISGRQQLAHLAESLCFDAPLAAMLGEIFDIVGEDGQVDVGTAHTRSLERQFVEGSYWPSSTLSPHMFTDQLKQRAELTNAALLISDLELDDPRAVVPLIAAAVEQGFGGLVVMARKLADPVIATLLSANRDPQRFLAIAVHTPGQGTIEQARAIDDLALLAGGRAFISAAGDSLRSFKAADLGRARRAWSDKRHFGIIGGSGDPRALRTHLATLRAALAHTADKTQRQAVQQRIGKLIGGSASLAVGGNSETEIAARETLARRTAQLVRIALHDGVLPGGGTALLACRPRLRERLAQATQLDEQVACRIVLQALEEPFRVICANAGYEAAAILGQLERAAPGYGLDVRTGTVVDMAAAGIFDVAAAQKAALRTAISGAATALTVDVMVHKRHPEEVPGKP